MILLYLDLYYVYITRFAYFIQLTSPRNITEFGYYSEELKDKAKLIIYYFLLKL